MLNNKELDDIAKIIVIPEIYYYKYILYSIPLFLLAAYLISVFLFFYC